MQFGMVVEFGTEIKKNLKNLDFPLFNSKNEGEKIVG